jgi:hypothetical protein
MRAMIAGISRGYSQAVNNRCTASDPTPRNNRALSSTQTHGCFFWSMKLMFLTAI